MRIVGRRWGLGIRFARGAIGLMFLQVWSIIIIPRVKEMVVWIAT